MRKTSMMTIAMLALLPTARAADSAGAPMTPAPMRPN